MALGDESAAVVLQSRWRGRQARERFDATCPAFHVEYNEGIRLMLSTISSFVETLESDISDMEAKLREQPSTSPLLKDQKGMAATLRGCLTIHQMMLQSLQSQWDAKFPFVLLGAALSKAVSMLRSYHSFVESSTRIYRLLYQEKAAAAPTSGPESLTSLEQWLQSSVGKRTNMRTTGDVLLSPVKHISDLAAAAQYLVRAHIAFADQVADEATEEDNRLCYSSYAALVQLSMALQQLENTRNTMQTMFLEESIDKFKVRVLPGHRRTVVRTGELKVNGELRSVFLFDDVAVIAKKQKKKLPYSFVLSIPMDACTLGNDEKLGFIITSGKKTYKFIGLTAQASLLWYVDFQKQVALWKSGSFGLPLDIFAVRTDKTTAGVPFILQFLLAYLHSNQHHNNTMCMCTHGDPYTIQAIRVTLERNALDRVDLNEFDPSAVVGITKYWFTSLPRSLLSPDLLHDKQLVDGESINLAFIRDHVETMSVVTRALLRQLIWFLNDSEVDSELLAQTWHPCVFQPTTSLDGVFKSELRSRVLARMITEAEFIFPEGVSDDWIRSPVKSISKPRSSSTSRAASSSLSSSLSSKASASSKDLVPVRAVSMASGLRRVRPKSVALPESDTALLKRSISAFAKDDTQMVPPQQQPSIALEPADDASSSSSDDDDDDDDDDEEIPPPPPPKDTSAATTTTPAAAAAAAPAPTTNGDDDDSDEEIPPPPPPKERRTSAAPPVSSKMAPPQAAPAPVPRATGSQIISTSKMAPPQSAPPPPVSRALSSKQLPPVGAPPPPAAVHVPEPSSSESTGRDPEPELENDSSNDTDDEDDDSDNEFDESRAMAVPALPEPPTHEALEHESESDDDDDDDEQPPALPSWQGHQDLSDDEGEEQEGEAESEPLANDDGNDDDADDADADADDDDDLEAMAMAAAMPELPSAPGPPAASIAATAKPAVVRPSTSSTLASAGLLGPKPITASAAPLIVPAAMAPVIPSGSTSIGSIARAGGRSIAISSSGGINLLGSSASSALPPLGSRPATAPVIPGLSAPIPGLTSASTPVLTSGSMPPPSMPALTGGTFKISSNTPSILAGPPLIGSASTNSSSSSDLGARRVSISTGGSPLLAGGLLSSSSTPTIPGLSNAALVSATSTPQVSRPTTASAVAPTTTSKAASSSSIAQRAAAFSAAPATGSTAPATTKTKAQSPSRTPPPPEPTTAVERAATTDANEAAAESAEPSDATKQPKVRGRSSSSAYLAQMVLAQDVDLEPASAKKQAAARARSSSVAVWSPTAQEQEQESESKGGATGAAAVGGGRGRSSSSAVSSQALLANEHATAVGVEGGRGRSTSNSRSQPSDSDAEADAHETTTTPGKPAVVRRSVSSGISITSAQKTTRLVAGSPAGDSDSDVQLRQKPPVVRRTSSGSVVEGSSIVQPARPVSMSFATPPRLVEAQQQAQAQAPPRPPPEYDPELAQRQKEAILEQQRRLQQQRELEEATRSPDDIKRAKALDDFVAEVMAQLETQLTPLKMQAQKYATMLQNPALVGAQRQQVEEYRTKLGRQAQQLKLAAQARVTQFQQQQMMLKKQQEQQQQLREQRENFKKWQEEQLDASRRKMAAQSGSMSFSVPTASAAPTPAPAPATSSAATAPSAPDEAEGGDEW